MYSEKGQTLLEVVVVIAVSVIIVGALVFATISSLRNAHTAKNQAQATKLAQEGMEKTRTSRDRGGNITGGFAGTSWADPNLWSTNISVTTCDSSLIPPQICYFSLNSQGELVYKGASPNPPTGQGETIGNFTRYIILSDEAVSSNYTKWKTLTSLVIWSDFAGPHEARMTTVLRKL